MRLALLSQAAENYHLDRSSGLLDQLAVAFGDRNRLIIYQCPVTTFNTSTNTNTSTASTTDIGDSVSLALPEFSSVDLSALGLEVVALHPGKPR